MNLYWQRLRLWFWGRLWDRRLEAYRRYLRDNPRLRQEDSHTTYVAYSAFCKGWDEAKGYSIPDTTKAYELLHEKGMI